MLRIKKIGLEKKIAVFMLLVGFAMMVLIPTWQTPDEYTHLNQIGRSIGRDIEFAEIIAANVNIDINRIINNYDQKVNIDEMRQSMIAKPQYDIADLLPKSVDLTVIKHLPATIGIFLAIFIGLPAYWVLQMGELFSLLFYVFVCYRALKIMPIRKEIFAIAMLMPMSMQQAASINYDSVVLPLCFYLTAYIFKLKYQEEINLKHFVKLIMIWLLASYVKMPYCLLILLVLFLPLQNIHVRIGKFEINETVIKKYRVPVLVAGGILGVILMYLMREVYFVELILVMIRFWKRSLHLLFNTGKLYGASLVLSSVGNFGWLDTPISYGVAFIVYIFVALLAMINSDDKEKRNLVRWDRLVIWGTAIMLCVFTSIALVDHTIRVVFYGWEWTNDTYNLPEAFHHISYIGGIQGRYYLPFVSLLFIPLPQIKQIKRKNVWLTVSAFEVILFIYIVFVLLNRYWIT